MRLSSPSLTAESSLPSSSLPSYRLSPWADRGLISQLSTHFLRLSPSRSHTLLLPLPSVPFSISLPPSIILCSPSLTFMPSISLFALLHFTSSPSLSLSLSFLIFSLDYSDSPGLLLSSSVPFWCFTPFSFLLLFSSQWPFSSSLFPSLCLTHSIALLCSLP